MRIKDISLENRPRERMRQHGVSVLSDAEVLAVILQKGCKGENVVDMCNRLISLYGLNKLSSLSLTELKAVPGIGEAKAMQILAAFEISKRVSYKPGIQLNSARDVFDFLGPRMRDLKQEHFVVLLLDVKNRLIKEETVFIGTLDSALIHPREVFKSAIRESAASVILVHNHPSGDCTPSEEDLSITSKIKTASSSLGVSFLDHVIIGNNYWSWKG